mgnify:FL=1
MSLAISREVLKEELLLAQRILTKWQNKLDEGVPGLDYPAADEVQAEMFVRELVAEFQVVSGKLDNLASVLSDSTLG